MKKTILRASVAVLACMGMALAQTKMSGVGKCGKPENQQSVEVPDRANHMLAISKVACTWTTPIEINGQKGKGYSVTLSSDMTGTHSRDSGYVVIEMDNGDKAFVRFQGTGVMKGDTPESGDGNWTFAGGTGKLKGLKGKGTYKSTMTADGPEDKIEGEYTLASGGK